ncbi:MAG TPA: hypothetical protein VFP72_00570 [Kineosporiaceae bacterium]|nr:hypothetical protein [Kineosporiaceae bacterium]
MGQPDEAEIAKEIAYLMGMQSERQYQEYVSDVLGDRDPDEVTLAAIRSPQLVRRTLDALTAIINQINIDLAVNRRTRERDAEWERAALRVQNRYGMERNAVQRIVNEIDEREGRRGKPNPRARAMERLATENLAGPVPQGRFRDLLEEEKAKVEARRKAARQAARDARRRSR